MPTQRVQKLCALTDEQFARAVAHQLRLIIDRSHRDKTLAGSPDGFADRCRVGRGVFVAADIRLHMSWRDQSDLETQLYESSSPMMRGRASLHSNKTARERAEKVEQRSASYRPRDDYSAAHVDCMNLEDVLRQIKANAGDRRKIDVRLPHGRLPLDGAAITAILAR